MGLTPFVSGSCSDTTMGEPLPSPACMLFPQIFIFTTAKQDYTEKILDVLDPQKKLIR